MNIGIKTRTMVIVALMVAGYIQADARRHHHRHHPARVVVCAPTHRPAVKLRITEFPGNTIVAGRHKVSCFRHF